MTANESKIYGALLTLASLMVIALVVMGAPAREKVKCEGYNLGFVIEDDRDTFRIGDPISIVNTTNNINSLKWLVSDLDSILVGKSMQEQSIVLVFTREGEKNIQLRINDREDCTTVAKRIFIMPHCSDGLQNGSETEIDCGGNCPPCETTPSQPIAGTTPPPVARPTCYDGRQNGSETGIDCGGNCAPCAPRPINNLPYATIVRIAGEPICQTGITFDCGIPPQYNPTWSFADTGNEKFSGTRITHKFRNSGMYTIRVYIDNTQVGQKQFNIGACSGGLPPPTPPPTTRPPTTPTKASINLPSRLNCKEVITFSSTSKQAGSNLRWQVNGIEKTGANFYHTFEEAGTYTIKLYIGSSYSPADTRTFTVTCQAAAPPPLPLRSDIELYPVLKTRLQGITDEAAKGYTIVTKKGPKYQRLLGDTNICKRGKTKVRINNETEKSLDRYFKDIIDEHYIIDEVKVKKKDNCIELILITHHKN